MSRKSEIASDRIRIRSYRPTDQRAVIHLHTSGVPGGASLVDPPTGEFADMQGVDTRRSQDRIWVAEAGREVVGMVGLIEERPGVAVIRRLCVAPTWQNTDLTRRLVLAALRHRRCGGALKVILDTPCDSDRAIRLLGDLGFQYTRTRNESGRELIEFYLNLYKHDEGLQVCKSEGGTQ